MSNRVPMARLLLTPPTRPFSRSKFMTSSAIERQPLEESARVSIHSSAEVPPVVDSACKAMARLGYPDEDIFAVRLALDEALVNAVKHGNRSDPNKQVRVRYRITAERVLMVVADDGPGFDPARVT